MNYSDRVSLRDSINKELLSFGVIRKFRGHYGKNKNFSSIISSIPKDLKLKLEDYIKEFRSDEEAWFCLLHEDDFSLHLCKSCGKVTRFIKGSYVKSCSDECMVYLMTGPEQKEKASKTMMDRYGSKFFLGTDLCLEKTKETNIEKYGVPNVSMTDSVKQKIKNSTIKRYGVDNIFKRTDLMKVYYANSLGVDNPLKLDSVKKKAKKTKEEKDPGYINATKKSKNTKLLRYGSENYVNVEKIRDTIIKKYGSLENYYRIARKNYENTCISKYGRKSNVQVNIEHYDVWGNDEEFIKYVKGKYEKCGSLRLGIEAGYFNVGPGTVKLRVSKLGLLDYFYIVDSNLEVDVCEFLDSKGIVGYQRHCRSILKIGNCYQEIDILFPDKGIGLEINDIFTHNSLDSVNSYVKPKEMHYHRNKTSLSKSHNIRLIHLWEWEIRIPKLWDRVSSWLINLLSDKEKVYARDCEVKKVDKKDEIEFLNTYHIQGYRKSEICLGLYYHNCLVQVMSFVSSRYNKNFEWELLRLCTKHGVNVLGGTNKLLKHFEKLYNPKSLISYCDLSKFSGDVYGRIGMKLLKVTEPQVIWCNKDMKHFSNSSLNLIGADKLLGVSYGKGTSNKDIVIKHGYLPVFNCGLAVYIKNWR